MSAFNRNRSHSHDGKNLLGLATKPSSVSLDAYVDELRQQGKLDGILVDWRPEFIAFEVDVGEGAEFHAVYNDHLYRLLGDKTSFLREQRNAIEAKDSTISVIDTFKLELGDIVLSTTNGFESSVIRWATRGPVSHAAIHVGGGFLIEAVDEGVRKAHVRSFIFPSDRFVRVLRPKRIAGRASIERATRIARTLVYRPYSTWNAVASVIPILHFPREYGRFCSQIVAESYAAAGAPIISARPSAVTPAMLLQSPHLHDVSAKVLRTIRRQSWAEAISTLNPDSYSMAWWPSFDRWCTGQNFERVVLMLANSGIRRAGLTDRIRLAYNYFDLMKLLTENSADREVRRLDEQLAVVMEAIMQRFWVVPKGIVDRLIGRPIMWDMNSRRLQNDSASELRRLLRELYDGREWNENDVTEARDELLAAAKKSGLSSVTTAATIVFRDYAYTLDEYNMMGLNAVADVH